MTFLDFYSLATFYFWSFGVGIACATVLCWLLPPRRKM